MVATAFVDVAVIPMDRERVLPHQTVLVQGDRIIALGPVARVRVPAGARRVDGRGKYLIPGLADLHAHLQSSDSAKAEQVLLLNLASGVTTIRNVDYLWPTGGHPGSGSNMMAILGGLVKLDGAFLLRLRARAAAGALLSPRIYTSGPWHSSSDSSIPQQIAAYKAAGYDFLKIHDEDSITTDSVVTAARQVGIPVLGHVPDDFGLERALAGGYASIEHLTGYLPALVRGTAPLATKAALIDSSRVSTPTTVARMRQAFDFSRIPALAAATRRAGVWNCPTLELVAEFQTHDVRRDTVAQWPEFRYVPLQARAAMLGARAKQPRNAATAVGRVVPEAGGVHDAMYRLVRGLQAAGAGLLSGTDAGAGRVSPELMPGFALHRELAVLVRAGLTPYQALATSTRNVAAYFGTLRESGTIATGKRADLVLLEGNPLVDIHQTTRIVGVMHDGRWWPRAQLEPRVKAALRNLTAAVAPPSAGIAPPHP